MHRGKMNVRVESTFTFQEAGLTVVTESCAFLVGLAAANPS